MTSQAYTFTKRRGIYIDAKKGLTIVAFAVLLACGVGLLVYFIAPRYKKCECPQDTLLGKNTPDGKNFTVSLCMEYALNGSSELCKLCPASSTDSFPTPSTNLYTTNKPHSFSTSTDYSTTEKPPKLNYRIPKHLEPIAYDIELRPDIYTGDPDNFSFEGFVRIELLCQKRTNVVYLHMNRLTLYNSSIQFGRLDQVVTSSPNIVGYRYDKERQFLIFTLDRELEEEQIYFIEMEYMGPITSDMTGLYYSTYPENNITKYMLTSLAGLTEARKIFPCLDEPSLKAKFNVTLLRKPELFSLSNMPTAYNESRTDGWIADVYEPTVKMSTYLLVFIVCEFEFKQNFTTNNIQVRTFAQPNSISQLDVALQTGTQILTFFEDYFNVSFPLPKQDMIAVPDFPFGAMENWGLITYRESRLLFQEGVSSESNRQSIVATVVHENAHQWFGNLVSPAWWDDAWLNEGFASFMEYLGADHLHPDWRMTEQFVVTKLYKVFKFDGLATSHPLVVPVSTPDEINEAFDDISYLKGASIIRMMRFFIGDDTFRRGLTRYLTNLKYKAVTHDDLWYALSNQTLAEGKYLDVKGIMDTWTLQMNYPVLKASRIGENSIRFEQTRYLADPTSAETEKFESPFGYRWDIPITYTSSSEQKFNKTSDDVLFLDNSGSELNHQDTNLPPSSDPDTWIIANLMQYGYYRVNYDESNWLALIKQLKTNHQVIPTINRAQIINDAWNLAKSGQVPQKIALKTVEYLSKERDNIPWVAAIGELSYIDTMLVESSLYGSYSEFMVSILQDSFNTSSLGLFGKACAFGVINCVSAAQDMFEEWRANPEVNLIEPGWKQSVICTAIQHGSYREWDFAYARYQNENVATEKTKILSALGCSKEVWVLRRYLSFSLDQNRVRSQDAIGVIIAVAQNPSGQSLAWDYVRENWDEIFKTFGSSLFSFSKLINGVTASFNTEFKLSQLIAFKNSRTNLGTATRTFDQAVEKTKANIKWMKNNEPSIRDWLNAQSL